MMLLIWCYDGVCPRGNTGTYQKLLFTGCGLCFKSVGASVEADHSIW